MSQEMLHSHACSFTAWEDNSVLCKKEMKHPKPWLLGFLLTCAPKGCLREPQLNSSKLIRCYSLPTLFPEPRLVLFLICFLDAVRKGGQIASFFLPVKSNGPSVYSGHRRDSSLSKPAEWMGREPTMYIRYCITNAVGMCACVCRI